MSRARPSGQSPALLDRGFRVIASHARSLYAALGIYILGGAVVAIAGTWGFAELAEHVRGGATLELDRIILTWMGAHQIPWIQSVGLEITALGTGSVVVVLAVVAALFLMLGGHRFSAILLVAATVGGLVLNGVLKLVFDRPRPTIFTWGTHVTSSSFPSGHAMNAVIVYLTIAYLATHLERQWWARGLTMGVALVIVVLICLSRLYLGVHYPSDVMAGSIIGLAWAGFCVSGLGAARVFARRFRTRVPRPDAAPPDGEARID